MVKVLICEDTDTKMAAIVAFIEETGISGIEIEKATSMAEFTSKFDQDVDICIIDIRIPAYSGGRADQNGIGVLQHLESSSNGSAKLLAISSYPKEFEDIRSRFERQGCILADFTKTEGWQYLLRSLILQCANKRRFDFLIFTALRKERAPYTAMAELHGKSTTSDGLTRYDVQVGSRFGSIIELPRMGLIDASIIAAKCIDRYAPSLVGMSGICAGFEGRAEMGQLMISETTYEYQTGKWTGDGFEAEPYQVAMTEPMRARTREIIEDDDLVATLEGNWKGNRPEQRRRPKMSVFTSGSAVIADAAYLEQVQTHHRKVAGLDMEVFGIHRAAALSSRGPDVLCAKVVVDMGSETKDDKLHPYGCMVSAKFMIHAINHYYEQ